MQNTIYPIYILARVALEIQEQCKKAVPNETLGRLLGYRCSYQGQNYIKIVDWIGGTIDAGYAFAQFTSQGSRECELYCDEKYCDTEMRPKEVGLFHSHPFNVEPHFSSIDYGTFLSFPYNHPGNVFLLLDPLSKYFKAFIIRPNKNTLQQVSFIVYHP